MIKTQNVKSNQYLENLQEYFKVIVRGSVNGLFKRKRSKIDLLLKLNKYGLRVGEFMPHGILSFEEPKPNKNKPFRLYIQGFMPYMVLTRPLLDLNLIPIKHNADQELEADGALILIYDGKGNGELHVLDKNLNTVRVSKLKTVKHYSKESILSMWKFLKINDVFDGSLRNYILPFSSSK